ncbi:MAG TPA: UDP-N-acetylmuramate dehydrogenase [Caulobacteraceae bacterium]|nr:UDP-N-acetylmuramate dehydrogenase [Caulobacteraceae bacterium]
MSLAELLPPARGRLLFNESLAPITWLRVGGPAEALFLPADEDDLAEFLAALPSDIPVTVLGAGSNVLVRDGGIEGVVIRLAGRAFGDIHHDPDGAGVAVGAGILDAVLARALAREGLAGLEFFAGIPGSIGGALTMNAGCYGSETAEVLLTAWGVDRTGQRRAFSAADLGFSYRRSRAPADLVWTGAVLRVRPGDPEAIKGRIAEITATREATQPIRERTGGSTFKNPPGEAAWRLIDAAGWRGRPLGQAQFSERHANFLIAGDNATAADVETLGETVRAEVSQRFGIELEWEIRRLGKEKQA